MNAPSLPLFYKKPAPLSADRHSNLAVKARIDFRFARETNSLPLNAAEFAAACRHYPIVFAGPDEDPVPVAVLGFKKGQNLFVDEKGAWAQGTYIPGYVRRYPFIFLKESMGDRFILGVDEDAEVLERPAGGASDPERALFVDGKPSPVTERAMEYCKSYQAGVNATHAFAKALIGAGVLVDQQAQLRSPDGGVSLSGFRVIDQKKFSALPDESFLEWRRKGYLPLVYAHFVSLGTWDTLSLRLGERQARA